MVMTYEEKTSMAATMKATVTTLLAIRGDLERMDVRESGWRSALEQRERRQERAAHEDRLQGQLAQLGSLLLDAVLEGQELLLLDALRDQLVSRSTLPHQPRASVAAPAPVAAVPAPAPAPAPQLVVYSPVAAVPAPVPAPALRAEPSLDRASSAHERGPRASQPLVVEPEPSAPAAPSQALTPTPTPTPTSKPAPLAAAAPAPAASVEAIEQLEAKIRSNSFKSLGSGRDVRKDATRQSIITSALAHEALLTGRLTPTRTLQAKLDALHALIQDQARLWPHAGAPAHQDLCQWLASLARHVQEQARSQQPEATQAHAALRDMFGRMSEHAKTRSPGRVHGLALDHQPLHGTWHADVQRCSRDLHRWLDESAAIVAAAPAPKASSVGPLASLLSAASPQAEANYDDALRRLTERVRDGLEADDFKAELRALQTRGFVLESCTRLVNLSMGYEEELSGRPFKKLREVIRQRHRALEADIEAQEDVLPEGWPWFKHLEGKRVALVGGDPRHERLGKIKDAFGFGSIEWIKRGPRHVQSLVDRLKHGSVDVVILLQCYCPHSASIPLFRLRKNPHQPDFLLVQAEAYGIDQLRRGVERYLSSLEQTAD